MDNSCLRHCRCVAGGKLGNMFHKDWRGDGRSVDFDCDPHSRHYPWWLLEDSPISQEQLVPDSFHEPGQEEKGVRLGRILTYYSLISREKYNSSNKPPANRGFHSLLLMV